MANSVHEQTNVESGREGQGEHRSRAAHSIPCIAGTRLGKRISNISRKYSNRYPQDNASHTNLPVMSACTRCDMQTFEAASHGGRLSLLPIVQLSTRPLLLFFSSH